MKVTRPIEETACDVCGQAQTQMRVCSVCKKDICHIHVMEWRVIVEQNQGALGDTAIICVECGIKIDRTFKNLGIFKNTMLIRKENLK
ncbi:MAG: hypothetical protein UV64_C0007G0013 [Parcubacteria group bacterium GW2011_GWC1_43_11b]|nr:MAG: hypothetical protein UV64_C0007G0013 [Parcubacteria group bacterium GW2011_GWC1_43_11b]